VTNYPNQQADSDQLRQLYGLQFLVALFALAQIGTSYQLWLPQSQFPQVPVIHGFVWPGALAWTLLGVMVLGLLGQLIDSLRGQLSKRFSLLFLLSAGSLLLEDQHRAQPWMIHYLWISLWILIGPPRRTLTLVLVLTTSLYAYSAISKANFMFLEQHGQVILSGLFRSLSLDLNRIPETIRRLLIAIFPVGEFLLAIGLLILGTRRLAACLSLIMHGLLILTFSSRGLNHEWSVLLWNGFFLFQAFWLWCLPKQVLQLKNDVPESSQLRYDKLLICWIVFFWSFPLLRLTGHLDQWLGWSLYSPRAVVVRVLLAKPPTQIADNFPPFTNDPYRWIEGDAGPLVFVSDRWSINQLHVPLNPEPRLEIAVAWALCEKYNCWEDLIVVVEQRNLMSPTDRKAEQFTGQTELKELRRQFLLPTQSNHRFLDNNGQHQ
jgi:hypothetical protein